MSAADLISLDRPVRWLTHGNPFHADEVLAFAIGTLAFAGKGVTLRRGRDPRDFVWADVVSDVGRRNELEAPGGSHSTWRYWLDHHQPEGAGERPDGVPYAAAGLAWLHFGRQAIRSVLRTAEWGEPEEAVRDQVEYVYDQVGRLVVAPTDAADNGYDLATGYRPGTAVRPCTLSTMVAAFNRPWDYPADPGWNPDNEFLAATEWVRGYLTKAIHQAASAYEARGVVREAYASREDPRVLTLPVGCPWPHTLLEELADSQVLYVVYPQDDTGWMVQCVPTTPAEWTKHRHPLPSLWAGLRDRDLVEQSGVPDAVFCHRGRFIGGARSREGAVAMARRAADASV